MVSLFPLLLLCCNLRSFLSHLLSPVRATAAACDKTRQLPWKFLCLECGASPSLAGAGKDSQRLWEKSQVNGFANSLHFHLLINKLEGMKKSHYQLRFWPLAAPREKILVCCLFDIIQITLWLLSWILESWVKFFEQAHSELSTLQNPSCRAAQLSLNVK